MSLFNSSQGNAAKESKIYRDNQNGYFQFIPPNGWTLKTYKDDRTKVAFYHPSSKAVHIRLIVRETPGYTFQEMKRESENIRQNWKSKGLLIDLKETKVLGVDAISIQADIPNTGHTNIIKFIKYGIHFSIAYNTSNKDQNKKYYEEVAKSIESIVVLKTKLLDDKKAKQQQLSHYNRSIQLIYEMGDQDEACKLLKNLLQEFPNNEEGKEMMGTICR